MDRYNQFIGVLISLKVIFIILAFLHFYNHTTGTGNSQEDQHIVYWKDRVEFVFTIGMALLLLYVFSPKRRDTHIITKETKILFFMFGFVLILTARWENFIETSKWFKLLQGAFR